MSEYSLDYLAKRDIVIFGADFWAEDWIKMPPEALLKRLIDSVEAAGKGILLLHDSQEQTRPCCPISCAICVTIATG